MKPTLYKFHLINRHGHVMYERYVVASGVNEAKRSLRQSSPYYKDVKFKVKCLGDVLVVSPNLPTDEEIENAEFHLGGHSINFIKGAQWMKEQIKQ